MWWPNHIVPAHVLREAKNIACCVWKTSQDCISVYMLWRFEIWENLFNSYTIITVWWGLSPSRYILKLSHLLEYTLAIIFKAFFIFLLFFFFAYFYLSKSYMGILEIKKRYPMMVSIWHSNFAIPKHTNVINTALLLCRSIQVSYYDWRATVVRWLFIPFS